MRTRRRRGRDGSAGADIAVRQHDPHHAGFSDQPAIRRAVEHSGHQAGLKPIQLQAGVAEASDLNDRRCAQMQAGSGGKPQQINAASQHVLPDIALAESEALGHEFVEQLSMDQVNLP